MNVPVHWVSDTGLDRRGGRVVRRPDVAVKWRKWTFGFWTDPDNWTFFGIDFGPLEVVWRREGYRP